MIACPRPSLLSPDLLVPIAGIVCPRRSLLSLDLLVGFHVNMIVGLEGMDLVVWELDTLKVRFDGPTLQGKRGVAYVKPLISVYSWVIVPPSALALSFALS